MWTITPNGLRSYTFSDVSVHRFLFCVFLRLYPTEICLRLRFAMSNDCRLKWSVTFITYLKYHYVDTQLNRNDECILVLQIWSLKSLSSKPWFASNKYYHLFLTIEEVDILRLMKFMRVMTWECSKIISGSEAVVVRVIHEEAILEKCVGSSRYTCLRQE